MRIDFNGFFRWRNHSSPIYWVCLTFRALNNL